ncbi:MAG: UDP-N-acetylglucosamine--N-acetylmuramyl-(pentapeptide) pyrophosphoryl-undecaprenol N-acetylglucosamine transferase [Clostridiales bacterium]|nr:UDP-N-acetylglucosamine--N-acetylmuramyl-(pentapeptide) pyrophosphoryl-undecaprenol N-acetylglucosamine transferase [Clostridiales bacterium]
MKKIVFTGGGTAGHITPNLALIDALKGEYECLYVGTDGMEKELCAKRNIAFYEVPAVKLRRDAFFKNLLLPFKLSSCVKRAVKTLKQVKPDLVFSKGGYVALPTVLAANKLKIPVLCHESDISPGITTKITSRRAKKVLCAFEQAASKFARGVYVGTPIPPSLISYKKTAIGSKPRLLIMGGSSGAKAINDALSAALYRLTERFDVVHITGKNKGDDILAPGYEKIEFCSDMPKLYSSVDIAVSRAGANSLFELLVLKIPTVAIPLEKASRGDQIQNAEYFYGKGALSVLREGSLTADSLIDAVNKTYDERDSIRASISALPPIDGTKKIISIIKEVIENNNRTIKSSENNFSAT